MAAIELARLLALGDRGAVAGGGEEGRDAGAAGADLLGQRALRGQFDFQFATEQLLLEQGVLADIGGDHLADLPVFQQHAEAETVDAAVVRDHREVPDPAPADFRDQVLGNPAEAEAPGEDGHAVGQAFEGLFVTAYSLVESAHAAVPLPALVIVRAAV